MKNITLRSLALSLSLFFIALGASSASWQIYGSGVDTGAMMAAADYTIRSESDICYAKNGSTGSDDFFGSNAGYVINKVINALGEDGGSIAIKTGTYPVGTTINLRSNVSIYGDRGAVLKLNHSGHVIVGKGVEGCELSGFEIDGNKSKYTGFGVWLILGSKHNLVSGLYVHDCKIDGIIFGDATTKYNRIVGNRVENCEGGGIVLAASAGDSIVKGNYVYRTRNHAIGITFGGSNCQIINNKIVGAGYFGQPGDFNHGIAVDSNGGAEPHGYNNIISGNIIIDANWAGIEVADTQDFCVISNNIVENPKSYGIYFGGGMAPSSNTTIVGNIVKNSPDSGIRVGSPWGEQTTTVNATIGNNFVSDCSWNGIHIDTVGHVNISDNICLNNNVNGIYVAGENASLIANRINIIGNQSYDNRSQRLQQYGLYLKNADYVNVIGNMLEPNKTGAIYTSNVSNYIQENNQLGSPVAEDILLADFENGDAFPSQWVEGSNTSVSIEALSAQTGTVKNGSYSMYWLTDITGVQHPVTNSWPTIEMPVPSGSKNWSDSSYVGAWLYFEMSTEEKLGWMIQLNIQHPYPNQALVDWHAGDTPGEGVPANTWINHKWSISGIANQLGNVSHFRMRFHAEDDFAGVAVDNKIGIYVDDVSVLGTESTKANMDLY